MEPLPRLAEVKVSYVVVVNERVTVCLEYRLNGEKTVQCFLHRNHCGLWVKLKPSKGSNLHKLGPHIQD